MVFPILAPGQELATLNLLVGVRECATRAAYTVVETLVALPEWPP